MGSLAWRSACKAGPSRVLRKAAGRPPRIFLQQLSCHKVPSPCSPDTFSFLPAQPRTCLCWLAESPAIRHCV